MKTDGSKKHLLAEGSRKKKKKKKLNPTKRRRISSSSSYTSDSVEKHHSQTKRTKQKPQRSSEPKGSKGSKKLARSSRYRSSSPRVRSKSGARDRLKESVACTRRRRSCSTCSGYYTISSESSDQSPRDKYYRGRIQDPSMKQRANRNSWDPEKSHLEVDANCREWKETEEGKIVVKKNLSQMVEDRDTIHMNDATDTHPSHKYFDKMNEMELPTKCHQRRPANSLNHDMKATRGESTGKRKRGNIDSSGLSVADDLEMILRQKALENFIKYQIQNSMDNKAVSRCKSESLQDSSCQVLRKTPEMEKLGQEVKNNVTSCKTKPTSSFEGQISGAKGIAATRVPKVSSIVVSREGNIKNASPSIANQNDSHNTLLYKPVTIGGSNADSSTARPNRVTGEPSNRVSAKLELSAKDVKDMVQIAEVGSSNRASSEQLLLAKDTQGKKVSLGNIGNQKTVNENKETEGSTHHFQNPQAPTCSPMEPTTGSQFEEKTFSRMHQGEVVQVSYKVYIPKRSATLARRKLQR